VYADSRLLLATHGQRVKTEIPKGVVGPIHRMQEEKMMQDTRSERLIIDELLVRMRAMEKQTDAQSRRIEMLVREQGDQGEVAAPPRTTNGAETAK
jgi:hypothetical protein